MHYNKQISSWEYAIKTVSLILAMPFLFFHIKNISVISIVAIYIIETKFCIALAAVSLILCEPLYQRKVL